MSKYREILKRVLGESKERNFQSSFEVITQERSNELFNHAVIEGDRELTKEMIARAELHPIAEIKLDKIKIGISKKFEGTNNYPSVLGYVEKDGKILLCTFYKSDSSNMWRYLPGYHLENSGVQFSKGHLGENAEDTLNLPMEVQKALHDFFSQYGDRAISQNDYVKEQANDLFLGTTSNLNSSGHLPRYFLEIPKQSESSYGNYLSGDLKSREAPDGNKMSLRNPEEIKVIGRQNPNFDILITTWEDSDSKYLYYPNPNSIKGEVEPIIYRVYLSKDKKIIYTFATTKITGRTFIASVEKTTSEYTTFGTKYEYIDAGCLTTPAQEYYTQTFKEGTNFRESYATRIPGGVHDLYQGYLSKISMIQDFEKSIS